MSGDVTVNLNGIFLEKQYDGRTAKLEKSFFLTSLDEEEVVCEAESFSLFESPPLITVNRVKVF